MADLKNMNSLKIDARKVTCHSDFNDKWPRIIETVHTNNKAIYDDGNEHGRSLLDFLYG